VRKPYGAQLFEEVKSMEEEDLNEEESEDEDWEDDEWQVPWRAWERYAAYYYFLFYQFPQTNSIDPKLMAKNQPPLPLGCKRKMTQKQNVVLYIDKRVLQSTDDFAEKL